MAKAVSEEDLCDEFTMFGVDLENEDVIAKLQELCAVHRLDAADIVLEWVAFSQSNKQVKLELEFFELFEREKLSKRNWKPKKDSTAVIHTKDTLDSIDTADAEELLTAYGGSTPTTSKGVLSNKRQHTPENGPLKRMSGPTRSPIVPFSPASFSPASATPAKKYNSRTNKGEVVTSVGRTKDIDWQGAGQGVTVEPYSPEQNMTSQFKYMFQKLVDKYRVLDDIIEDMSERLKTARDIEEFSHVSLPTQDEVTIVGRVCCDSNGRLNSKSVLLEGSVEGSAGRTIQLDLSQLKEYSLFPGQIVAVDGMNSTGAKFVAQKVHEGVCLPFPDVSPSSQPGNTRLSVLVAAGPFSTSDSLSYEPLSDLVQQIQQTRPDVCILMGPFVDCKNSEIESGKLQETYQKLFQKHMEQIAKATERLDCMMIVLPSNRDIHHDCVYPQPPFRLDKFNHKHVKFVPDPCTLKINNIVFGITSTDVLFHLGSEEISFPPSSGDRLGRLTRHLLYQHSFYPYYPSQEDMCIDYEQFQVYSGLPVTPHVLIVPSEFKQFVKDIKGCCCLNPGRLTKGLTGSTYAKLVIDVNNLKDNQSVVPNIAAQVVRI